MPEAVDDVKVKAVNEMMERIKHGVVLRPVKGQDTKVMLSVFINWIVYCFCISVCSDLWFAIFYLFCM